MVSIKSIVIALFATTAVATPAGLLDARTGTVSHSPQILFTYSQVKNHSQLSIYIASQLHKNLIPGIGLL